MASLLLLPFIAAGGATGALGGGILAGVTHLISTKRPVIQVVRQNFSIESIALASKAAGYGLSVVGGTMTGAGSAFTHFAKISKGGSYSPHLAPTVPEMLSENLFGLSFVGLGLGFIVLGNRLAAPTYASRQKEGV